jgi:hypothetical protein
MRFQSPAPSELAPHLDAGALGGLMVHGKPAA